MDKEKEFEIDGIITTPGKVTASEISDAIRDFVISKGWSFGGSIIPYIEFDFDKDQPH